MNIRIRKVVVSKNIPTTNIPEPILMYSINENVSRAITTMVMLEM